MSEETLLSAARRAVRFFNIDMAKGGVIVEETEQAFMTLELTLELTVGCGLPSPLHKAVRAALTTYSSDMNNGGLIRVDTQVRMQTVDREVRQESARQ